jgi:acetolactate synthase-1/2/3 large subunit
MPSDPLPSDDMTVKRTAAAELVTILFDEGISHLFLNPGMNTAALREALADAHAVGVPQPVLCVHEHVALSAAHGHHLASGLPQAVMVHVEAGGLSLGSAAENARRDQVPVVVLSGELGNGSEETIDELLWTHDRQGRAEVLRAAEKWAAQVPASGELSTIVRRAFQIARSEPTGLTHVTLPRDGLHLLAGQPSRRLPSPRLPAPDPAVLEEMAELLATAEAPVIVAGRVGRNLESVQHLAQLAETLAAPVIDFRNRVNLPPGHSLNAGPAARELLHQADAILLLDVDAPCLPALGPLPAQAWLLQIDTDCLKAHVPGWAYPIEIAISADTVQALPLLETLLADRLTARGRELGERRTRVEEVLGAARRTWRERAVSTSQADLADGVLAELNHALPEDSVVLEEAPATSGATLRQLERPPGHFFRRTSSSPGWSIGAALGARLARPTQPVVALCDAAGFNFGLPTAAFWSAHRAGAPFLTVVLSRRGSGDAAGEDESDLVAVARACGAESAVVKQPSEVAAAVERLLATTRDGVCAVLDARLM